LNLKTVVYVEITASSTCDLGLLLTVISVLSGEVAADCPVCLQPCVFPVKLPCSHVFCFLCLKGVAGRNRRCALCRAEIPQDFVRRPVLVGKDTVTVVAPADQQHLNSGRSLLKMTR